MNASGEIVGGESYVYFGRYKHRLSWDNIYETDATPVLWRVMETDATEATLLSCYLVDMMRYNEDGNNTWLGSSAQT